MRESKRTQDVWNAFLSLARIECTDLCMCWHFVFFTGFDSFQMEQELIGLSHISVIPIVYIDLWVVKWISIIRAPNQLFLVLIHFFFRSQNNHRKCAVLADKPNLDVYLQPLFTSHRCDQIDKDNNNKTLSVCCEQCVFSSKSSVCLHFVPRTRETKNTALYLVCLVKYFVAFCRRVVPLVSWSRCWHVEWVIFYKWMSAHDW